MLGFVPHRQPTEHLDKECGEQFVISRGIVFSSLPKQKRDGA